MLVANPSAAEHFDAVLKLDAENRIKLGVRELTPKRALLRDSLLEQHGILIVGEYTAAEMQIPRGYMTHLVRITGPIGTFKDVRDRFRFETIREFRITDIDRAGAVTDDEGEALANWLAFLAGSQRVGLADVIVFHCWAGVQRSAATALAYAKITGDEEAANLILENDMYAPHQCVANRILECGAAKNLW